MLHAYIIEELRKQEKERQRVSENEILIECPYDDPRTDEPWDDIADETDESGVVIIDFQI